MPKKVQNSFHVGDMADSNDEMDQSLSQKSEISGKKRSLFQKKRVDIDDPFMVEGTDSSSMNSTANLSMNIPKKKVFSKKLSNKAQTISFHVNSPNEISTAPSTDSINITELLRDTIDEESHPLQSKKNNIFKKKRINNDPFMVEGADSSSMNNTADLTMNNLKKKVFSKKLSNKAQTMSFHVNSPNEISTAPNKDSINNTELLRDTIDEGHPLQSKKNNIFQKKRINNDRFMVEYADSPGVNSTASTSVTTPTKKVHLFKKKPSGKADINSFDDPFTVDFADTASLNSTLNQTTNKGERRAFQRISSKNAKNNTFNVSFESGDDVTTPNSDANEEFKDQQNSSHGTIASTRANTYRNISAMSDFLRDEIENEKSLHNTLANEKSLHNTIANDTSISYNDENLNGWFSDDDSRTDADNASFRVEAPETAGTVTATRTRTQSAAALNCTLDFERELQEILSGSKKSNCLSLPLQPNKPSKNQAAKPASNSYKKPKLKKPANFATKRLYTYIIKQIQPKFGIDTAIRAEDFVNNLADVVKIVVRSKQYQKKLIEELKLEMAQLNIIKTTYDFYEFVREYLPHNFRSKVIPRIQPFTNTVWPPKDTRNPFDNILD